MEFDPCGRDDLGPAVFGAQHHAILHNFSSSGGSGASHSAAWASDWLVKPCAHELVSAERRLCGTLYSGLVGWLRFFLVTAIFTSTATLKTPRRDLHDSTFAE